MFLYINFHIRARDIQGYIALLMDMPSLTSLKQLLGQYIARTGGIAEPSDASA
jgi:chemotaxis protein CheC